MTVMAAPALRIDTRARLQLRKLGTEQQPLLVIDGLLADPEALVEAACAASFYRPEHTYYPGLNGPLPQAYYLTVVTALRGALAGAFGLAASAHIQFFGFFGLATLAAASAAPVQKIPHHDTVDPERLAMVHYLCRGDHGGTGFFRHLATGFESVDAGRHATYEAAVRAELSQSSPRGSYADEGLSGYQRIGDVDAVFNRLIVYRSHVLHSALLGEGGGASDPANGRLTANGFLQPVQPP